jgi:hypothetical protein
MIKQYFSSLSYEIQIVYIHVKHLFIYLSKFQSNKFKCVSNCDNKFKLT